MFPREPTSQPQIRFETLRFGNRVDWDRDWDIQEVSCDRFKLFCELNGLGLNLSDQHAPLDYSLPRYQCTWGFWDSE